jgi:hypothetical protein
VNPVDAPTPADAPRPAGARTRADAPTAPDVWYRNGEAAAHQEAQILEGRLRSLATTRFLAFLGGVIPLLLLETTPRGGWPVLGAASILGGVLFVGLVRKHRNTAQALRAIRIRETLHQEGLARIRRDWNALPEPDLGPLPDGHPWAVDLDVLGFGSLAHLLGTPRTEPGRAALRQALLGDPSSTPEGRAAHREAVWRLAEDPELLMRIQSAARLPELRPPAEDGLDRLLAWGEGPAWSPPSPRGASVWLARGVAALNGALFVLWFGGLPPFWLGGALVSTLLWVRARAEAHRRFDAVAGAASSLARWSALLDVAGSLPGEPELLRSIRSSALDPDDAALALRQLQRISDWAEIRQSALIYYPLAVLTAWDIHPMVPLERWRQRHGHRIRAWMEGVGMLERLTAFALLRFDHPHWSLPSEVSPSAGTPGVMARGLTHPLLPAHVAVGNDVEIPPAGQLLLLTGSNMSGKSTLLRALGVNQVLLLAGGPVAAFTYQAPPIQPWTSMRIRDSLLQGVSLFMAELRRLRQVVDAARAGPALVLLDEILQGTNTAERRTAARIILTHLRDAGAYGAVSTHDLTLADDEGLADHLRQVHLRESVVEVDGKRTLTFDHLLRPGPATSRNALILLEMVGLGTETS